MLEFKKRGLIIDGQVVAGTFENCMLVYQGGIPPLFDDFSAANCSWRLDGPALNTLIYLQAMLQTPSMRSIALNWLKLAEGPNLKVVD